MKNIKKAVAWLLIFAMVFSLTACASAYVQDKLIQALAEVEQEETEQPEQDEKPQSTPTKPVGTAASGDTQWAIYWYLCASDLETDGGAATIDISELLDVTLPENVQVIIQTGGAKSWQNDIVNPKKAQRYLYDSDGLTLIEEFDKVNMGETETLADFLSFAHENYPAEHVMVNFWNHGGGSLTGVAFDEQFNMDSLTLPELDAAFTTVFAKDDANPPIDIIGFDTCLMATIDVADTFCGFASYMVASQALEPGNGWLYSGIAHELASDPYMDPLNLSIVICDTFLEGCEQVGTEEDITISVTDLSKVDTLLTAYDAFGAEAFAGALENPSFFTEFSRAATQSENYGGNTKEQGYTNMVDLGHLAEQSLDLCPDTAPAVLNALNECVVYKINSRYCTQAQGLSCYYAYDGDVDNYNRYVEVGTSNSFKYFYSYGLTGGLTDDGMDYVHDMDYEEVPQVQTLYEMGWEDMPLTVQNGCAVLDLGPQAYDVLASIAFELYYMDYEEEVMICLGVDNDIAADWENGVFTDNFRGVWGSFNGSLCYMELVYEGYDYNEYAVPILLNGQDYILTVYYDFVSEAYYIDGARKPMDEYGAVDKNVRYLEEGDIIETILYGGSFYDETDTLVGVTIDTIVVTQDLTFEEAPLGDGDFMLLFRMSDYQNNIVYSDVASIEIIGDNIYTTGS